MSAEERDNIENILIYEWRQDNQYILSLSDDELLQLFNELKRWKLA